MNTMDSVDRRRSSEETRGNHKHKQNIQTRSSPRQRWELFTLWGHPITNTVSHSDKPSSSLSTMSNPPSAKSILQLYTQTLRTARSFSSYNFREYFIRRAKGTFKDIQVCSSSFYVARRFNYSSLGQGEKDPARVAVLYSDAARELTSLRRSAIVNQLYGGWTLAVEKQKLQRERSDN